MELISLLKGANLHSLKLINTWLLYITIGFLLVDLVSGCGVPQKTIDSKEFSNIYKIAPDLVKHEFESDDVSPEIMRIIPGTVKIHEILNIDNETYLMASLRYKVTGTRNDKALTGEDLEFMKRQTYEYTFLRIIQRSQSPGSYKLLGGVAEKEMFNQRQLLYV